MNITLFISSLYGGGAERVTCNLASYLADQGHIVEILTMAETEQSYELSNNVTIQTLLPMKDRRNSILDTVIRFPRLWKYLIKHKEKDAYLVMLPKTIIFLMAFRWMTKAKMIISERGNPEAYNKKIQKAMKKYASKADGYVFQTEDSKKWYNECINKINTVVIPNAINPAFIRSIYTGKRAKEIVSVGRLNKQKNFELLINAFSKIADRYSDYKLIIYGEGLYRKQLEALVASLKLCDRILLPGNVSNIADRIEGASLYVLSSDYEGMPNALIEAMALGLPCISTDCPVGGPRFLIKNNFNGILTPVGNVEELAEAINQVLNDDEYALELGKNASRVQEKLAPEKIYAQWEKFIVDIVIR